MEALPLAAWMRQDELVRSRMNVVRLIGQIDTRKSDGLSTKPVDLPPDPNNLILKQLYLYYHLMPLSLLSGDETTSKVILPSLATEQLISV